MTLRTRLHEGRWNKARKGQLARSVPTGYVVDEDGRWAGRARINHQPKTTLAR